jgi:phospholipase/carboxylesterase
MPVFAKIVASPIPPPRSGNSPPREIEGCKQERAVEYISHMPTDGLHQQGRLRSRPARPPAEGAPVGLQTLGSDGGPGGGYLYVPADYRPEKPAPLVLLLHGAGEDARDGLAQLRGQADEAGLILLALSSRGPTWDSILSRGRYGSDIVAIDRALEYAFSRCTVDPTRVAVAGYSDGASYALSLGIANGDLFSDVLAFSPGFLALAGQRGSPRIFISHGTQDRWLPIDSCSRKIVSQLERAGYEVRYHEFEGGHVVPSGIAREAVIWFTDRT